MIRKIKKHPGRVRNVSHYKPDSSLCDVQASFGFEMAVSLGYQALGDVYS